MKAIRRSNSKVIKKNSIDERLNSDTQQPPLQTEPEHREESSFEHEEDRPPSYFDNEVETPKFIRRVQGKTKSTGIEPASESVKAADEVESIETSVADQPETSAEVPTQPAKKRSILGMCAAPKAQPVARSAINAQRPSARKAFTVSEISAVLAVILVKKTSETGYPKEYFYPVTTDIQRQVQNELRFVEFRVAQDQQGQTFLLPTKLPHPDGFGASWSESAQKGAKAAVGQWVRMKANSDTQSYVTQVMQLARPIPSQESFLALEDAIEQALGDNLIDHPDHPVLAELGLVPLRDDVS